MFAKRQCTPLFESRGAQETEDVNELVVLRVSLEERHLEERHARPNW